MPLSHRSQNGHSFKGTKRTKTINCVLNAQTSDWQEVRLKAKDAWKSTTMEVGEQFVTTPLETLKPESFATVWDLG